jgi:putative tryptophan/tyrosine transport system substrate-binding protein
MKKKATVVSLSARLSTFSAMRSVLCLVGAMLLLLSFPAEAQQPKKIPRIGYLTRIGSAPSKAFLQGLRDLGYIEGKNILIEFRTTEGKSERLPELAAELIRMKVEVIVADTALEVTVAKNATATIPIVMRGVADPIALGLVASLAHPGGNITGIATLAPELSGKRLELLKEVIPKLSHVAFLTTPGKVWRTSIKETEVVAQALGLQLQVLQIREADELEGAFDVATKQRAGALLQAQATSLLPYQSRIIDLAAKNRLPTMYYNRRSVEIGGLMSYGREPFDMDRRVASMVDKILKGRKPADIPVEQPMKFEFVINLKTAKQIGLTIPPNLLARADRVIK